MSQDYKYLTLDGNNRWTFIRDLINDSYTIPVGNYTMLIGDTPHAFTVTKRNNVFSRLTGLQKQCLLDSVFVVTEYTQVSYAGLHEIFLGINSGVPLNPQEKRNAMDSDWSSYVRKLSLDLAPLLTLILGENYTKRLAGDDWIATTLAYTIYCNPDEPCGIVQSTKNKLYNENFGTHFTEDYRALFLQLQDYVLDLLNDKTMPVSEKDITMASFVQNLYWMMCNGLQEYEDVFAATVLHKDVRKDSSRVNEDGNNYVWACGGTGTKNNAFKMEVLTEILDKTSGYVPNARTLGFVFEDETEEDEVEV